MGPMDPFEKDRRNDDFIDGLFPKASRVICPETRPFPSGVWTEVLVPRSAFIRFESTTLYTLYCRPDRSITAAAPHLDNDTVKTVNNLVSLYGRGKWYVYHATGSTIYGKVVDAAAGASGLELIGAPPIVSALDAILASVLTAGTPDTNALSTTAETIVAANTARRGLYLRNNSVTAGEYITVTFGTTAVSLKGFILNPGSTGYLGDWLYWNVLDRCPTGLVSAIAATGTPTITFYEMT